MKVNASAALLAAVMLVASSGLAGAATVDFEGFAGGFGLTIPVGDLKFTVTDVSSGALSINARANVVEAATTKLFALNHSIVTMTSTLGAFELNGFDVGGSFIDFPARWAGEVLVTANFAGGGSSQKLVALPNSDPHYVHTSWLLHDVLSLVFEPHGKLGASNNDFEFTLDNIEVGASVVPLPAALPLFATGLGILGVAGWRKRRRAHEA